MTLRINEISDGQTKILRLIGRMSSEHLEQLKALVGDEGERVRLDLEEITLVDVEVVRFLKGCEAEGVELLNCSPYIREWIFREINEEGKREPTDGEYN
jgi:hypothetical protein